MNWAATTAVGTVLAGLALPLAFFQLGALRQDRLRAQVSKVGVWTGEPRKLDERADSWQMPLYIRNGSELPIRVDTVDVTVRPWGYDRVLAAPEGTSNVEYYMDKKFGESDEIPFALGTIAPGMTWDRGFFYGPKVRFDVPQPPMASVIRVVVADAAGYQWEIRPGRAGPALRVRWWRRWWWRRHGESWLANRGRTASLPVRRHRGG